VLFNSIEFWVFFAVFFALYVRFGKTGQNRLLLVASYVFYGSWDWRFLGLLIFTTIVDWFVASASAARMIGRQALASLSSRIRGAGFFT
jgi:D-alanyl-lipoteichoic acid acyltransferase DltB (MBOAT superfamily)